MSKPFRVVDAGLRDGRRNIALDQAMLELHQAGRIGDSLRFIHFEPAALVGRHQDLGAEIDRTYCREHGIGVGRRITGGGAIYLDPGQLGWALVFDRATFARGSLGDVARMICEAAAAGLSRLGAEVRFRPRNDLEIGGRKVGGTGGFYDGDTLFYQGTVLVDVDTDAMFGALRVPRAKIAKRSLDSAAQRVVTLRELMGAATPTIGEVEDALLRGFGEHLDMAFDRQALNEAEEQLAAELHDSQIGREDFVAEIDGPPAGGDVRVGVHTGAGGTITAYVRLEGAHGARLGQVLVTGDFFVAPPRWVFDLEGHLRGTPVRELDGAIEAFFAAHPPGALSVTAGDFRQALRNAMGAAATA